MPGAVRNGFQLFGSTFSCPGSMDCGELISFLACRIEQESWLP